MPQINYLTRIEFDFGAIARLGEEITGLGLKRPLLVTDRGIADAGILPRQHGPLSTTEPLKTLPSSRYWNASRSGRPTGVTG